MHDISHYQKHQYSLQERVKQKDSSCLVFKFPARRFKHVRIFGKYCKLYASTHAQSKQLLVEMCVESPQTLNFQPAQQRTSLGCYVTSKIFCIRVSVVTLYNVGSIFVFKVVFFPQFFFKIFLFCNVFSFFKLFTENRFAIWDVLSLPE